MQSQTNPLQTNEDKVNWTIERLTWIKDVTIPSRRDSAMLGVVPAVGIG